VPFDLLAPAAPLLAVSLGLLAAFDLVRHLTLALLLAAAGFAVLPFAVRRLESARGRPRAVGTAVLLGALVLRLPLLPVPPTLSDDVLRYLWDGKVAAAGSNPYSLAPEDPRLAPFRVTAGLPPHPQIPTIYPPLALAVFSIAAHLPFPILSWKLFASAADLAGCALLLRLARRQGLPEGRVAWYAWNPMVLIEVAGQGHVDALGITAAIAALTLLPASEEAASARRAAAAGAWAAAGALAKVGPIFALPLWARGSRRPAVFLAVAGALLLAGVVPVLLWTGGLPPAFSRFGISWEFDGPVYEPLWRLFDAAGLAPALARALDAWKVSRREFYVWNWIYPYLYPQFLVRIPLALGSLAAILLSLRERRPLAGTGKLFGRLLLLSATLHPWYVLWALPWAALARHRAWIALSGLVLPSYLVLYAGVPLWPWLYLAIWGPFFALLAVETRARRWSTA
jgi:hypothetical protein